MRHIMRMGLAVLAVTLLLPLSAYAQTGNVQGQVKDASGGALQGVTVEVSGVALIEKVRSATTDMNGRYQITGLPVGTYEVKFTLDGFSQVKRQNVIVTTDFSAPVNADMKVGAVSQTVNVVAEAPIVDVVNARQNIVFQGADIRELPTQRNIPDMLLLVPGMVTNRGNTFGVVDLCVGGVGVFCNPNLADFNAHASVNDSSLGVGENAGLNQGRIMIDGMVINSASPNGITGLTGGYNADVANAQEVSFTLSGALGESETGGASINIIPRTGGNRYSGNFFTAYTANALFDKNNGSRANKDNATTADDLNVVIPVNYDYDVNGAFGGPIIKDRLWFFSNARNQGKEAIPSPGQPFFWNKSYGVWGKNYVPDRDRGSLTYRNLYRNVNLRLTVQASQKNKFNIFWDEQDSCQDPCFGVVSVFTSPESWWSVQTRPNHLAQLSWTNPLTNRMLLDAGLSVVMQHYDTTKHREIANPRDIPRLIETGTTAGYDDVATRVNAFAGTAGFDLTSGSLNLGGAELRNLDSYRSRASASYITGSHNAKLGYEGGYYMQTTTGQVNDVRLTYNYTTPSLTCNVIVAPATAPTCGNQSLYFPDDPLNTTAKRPVPSMMTMNVGPRDINERVWYGALYLQDQWTLNRFTLNGAVRYDHAQSRYGETCVGGGGFEPFVPVQNGGEYNGLRYYCVHPSNGVNYNDITPRWGVAWDVFGNGKTAVKWNMGKYVAGATIGGLYQSTNPAARTVNTLARAWSDTNGNRVVDCDPFNFAINGECTTSIAGTNSNRYGRDPLALDASGLNASLFTTINCGMDNPNPTLLSYCAQSGNNLVGGWGSRNYNWQLGLGIQHELLPRLSVEVTYNKRWYGNQQSNDVLGTGCDRFNVGQFRPEEDCQKGYLNYTADQYDFYGVESPIDPRLPNGGGYVIRGISTQKALATLPNGGTAVSYDKDLNYSWNGVDTNFVLRARGGLRLSGGTSTGRANRDTCYSTLDGPNVVGRVELDPACHVHRPFQTNVRANASYTVPYVDILVSTVFQYRPGAERSANLTYAQTDAIWEAGAADRATRPCTVFGVATQGCFYANNFGIVSATNTGTVNLLSAGDLYGEGVRLFDLKFAKNFRFGSRRVNFGVDIYNLFNSDAISSYNNTYQAYRATDGTWKQGDNPATNAVEVQSWGRPAGLISPRFMRFQVQFDF